MPPACEDLLRSTDNWILTGSAIFRRDCVTWAGGFDARLGSFADGFIARKVALKYGFLFEPEIVASWVVFPDSVSRKTALDLQRTKYILDVVPTLIAADPGFPSWYADAFRNRWRLPRAAWRSRPIRSSGRSLRTGCAFRRREGQIGVDFGLAAPELGALGDSGPAMVSAAADIANRAVAHDADDARPSPRFALSVWANTRYEGADRRARRRLKSQALHFRRSPF